ncbi:MAG: DUF805 domain-containing protein [Thermoguttaceae bacterium]|nr:DUF805 domain-containing protein [Thermoguttaceae bacterium]
MGVPRLRNFANFTGHSPRWCMWAGTAGIFLFQLFSQWIFRNELEALRSFLFQARLDAYLPWVPALELLLRGLCLWGFFFFLPGFLFLQIRRLHDAGHRGWWVLLWVFPFIAARFAENLTQFFLIGSPAYLLLLYLLLKKGTPGENRFDLPRSAGVRLAQRTVNWLTAGAFALAVLLQIVPFPRDWQTEESGFVHPPADEDGRIDYFAVLTAEYEPAFKVPEENGFRLLLEYFAPDVLGAHPAGRQRLGVSEEIQPVGKFLPPSRFWEGKIREMEEQYASQHDEEYTSQHDEEETWLLDLDQVSEIDLEAEKYLKFNLAQPWKSEEYPLAAEYLQEYGSALDVIVRAVEKPYLMPCLENFWNEPELTLNEIGDLADLGLLSIASEGLLLRSGYNLGKGDRELAIRDSLALCRLGIHLQKTHFFRDIESGIKAESHGRAQLERILAIPDLSPEEREFLEKGIMALPEPPEFSRILHRCQFPVWALIQKQFRNRDPVLQRQINRLLRDVEKLANAETDADHKQVMDRIMKKMVLYGTIYPNEETWTMFLSRSGRAELFYSGISALLYRDFSQLGERWFELRKKRQDLVLTLNEEVREMKNSANAEGIQTSKDTEEVNETQNSENGGLEMESAIEI